MAARRGEVFRLKWSDIDFNRNLVTLYTRKRQNGTLEADHVQMTSELRHALLWWWENRPIKSEHVFVCLEDSPFTKAYFGKPFDKRTQFMRRLCDKAGVKRFGFHSIRHLTASILDQKKVELTIIQSVLRHKSATTTARYTHSIRGVGEVLEEVMPKYQGKVHELKKASST